MSRTDRMAAGLASQPSTEPAMASCRWSHLAASVSLILALVSLPPASPARPQRSAPSGADAGAPSSTPAPATPAAAPVPVAENADAPARILTGLVTIEADQQRADQLTGVITAIGNVRIVYPDQRVVATARQAQYFSREGRVILSGDVDIIQEGGNLLRAEQVIYLVESERMIAVPPQGQQVFSQVRMLADQQAPSARPTRSQPGPQGLP